MRLKEKINILQYILLMAVSAVVALIYAHSLREILGISLAYIGIVANHLFHIYAASAMLNLQEEHRGKAIVFMLLKTIILAVFLIFSVQMMEKKIIIPVIIYLFMLVVFTLSLKRVPSGEGTKE